MFLSSLPWGAGKPHCLFKAPESKPEDVCFILLSRVIVLEFPANDFPSLSLCVLASGLLGRCIRRLGLPDRTLQAGGLHTDVHSLTLLEARILRSRCL